jgi:hypothetical protein
MERKVGRKKKKSIYNMYNNIIFNVCIYIERAYFSAKSTSMLDEEKKLKECSFKPVMNQRFSKEEKKNYLFYLVMYIYNKKIYR